MLTTDADDMQFVPGKEVRDPVKMTMLAGKSYIQMNQASRTTPQKLHTLYDAVIDIEKGALYGLMVTLGATSAVLAALSF